MAYVQVQVPCPAGCHSGVAGEVSRYMAMDAGDMSLEGQPIPCHRCGGDGWVIGLVPAPNDSKEVDRG